MSTVNTNLYIDYFRQLAVQHHMLRHNPLSEDADTNPGLKHFTRWGIEEAITGLRSKIGYPCLMLEMFEINTAAQTVHDIRGIYRGAFTVIDHARVNNFAEEISAYEKCEQIIDELLRKIWADHYAKNHDRCETPFTDFFFTNLNIVPVGPILDNDFGWRVEFSFKPRLTIDVKSPLPQGTFVEPDSIP